ncbi:hypothetical protein D3C71_1346250 [compost metagenome]
MTPLRLACLGLLGLLPTSAFADAAPLDLTALIECRQSVSDYDAVAPVVADPLKAVANGLQPLPQTNQFMTEFRLAAPITVFGERAEYITVAGASIMAILDLADPRPLAKRLALEDGVDTPAKFMAGRELVSRDVTDPRTGEALIESVILSLSTVKTHPGKTLAGCTYSLDLPPEEDTPPPGAAPAPLPGVNPPSAGR